MKSDASHEKIDLFGVQNFGNFTFVKSGLYLNHCGKFGIKITRNSSAIRKIIFLVDILESFCTRQGHV